MMIAWSACILGGASLVLLAAYWFAQIAARHARDARDALRDTKTAIAEWWSRAESGR